MKKTSFALWMCGVVAVSCGLVKPAQAQNALWSGDRAATVPQGRYELGLFSPSRMALSEESELSTTLLLNFLVPNIELKLVWPSQTTWQLATRHRLTYPTLLFKTVSASGAGGLLPETTQVPQIVGVENEAILERAITGKHSIALHLGVSVAPRLTDGELPLIDFPLLYPRLSAANTWATVRAGARLRGQLGHHWAYTLGAEAFLLPAVEGGVALEQALALDWRISRTWSLWGGYLMSFAHYPYGGRFHVMPTFDVIYALE